MNADEKSIIKKTDDPITEEKLVSDLKSLGICSGETIIVHASLSSIGWVVGGAPTVIDALQTVVTGEGNIVMPTFTGHYSDPEYWSNPSVPDDWIDKIRESIPPFRPECTPTRRTMGSIPECFRSYPNVHRSRHPYHSFAAWGKENSYIIANHSYKFGHGEETPLSKVYELDGHVLLLGCDHNKNSSLHLAEDRADYDNKARENGGPVLIDGERTWLSFLELKPVDDFLIVGTEFEDTQSHSIKKGTVGNASSKYFSQRSVVDFATEWFSSNR